MEVRPEVPSGLRPAEVLGLVLGCLLLTPLLGGAMALHWRQTRPRAGRQAMTIVVVLAVFLASIWFVWVFGG